MYCSKCGKQIEDDATFCKHCGYRIKQKEKKNPFENLDIEMKINKEFTQKYKKHIIIGICVFIALLYLLVFKCKAGFCPLPSVIGSDYCSTHTCNRSNCYNKVAKGKDYCYTHMPSSSSGFNYTPESAEDVLDFSDVNVSKNSSYTICNAAITNNGKKTYTFVEVKGKFEDSSGKIIDTDWTYAVGSEGLAPGESTTFRLSVDKDSNITKCELEILDYDKE